MKLWYKIVYKTLQFKTLGAFTMKRNNIFKYAIIFLMGIFLIYGLYYFTLKHFKEKLSRDLILNDLFLESSDVTNAKNTAEILCHYFYESSACWDLGYMYAEGMGVVKNYEKAFNYFEKACNLKDSNGCSSLGIMFSNGNGSGVSKNDLYAFSFYKKACDYRDINGGDYYCMIVGDMLLKGFAYKNFLTLPPLTHPMLKKLKSIIKRLVMHV